jgi:dGTPase
MTGPPSRPYAASDATSRGRLHEEPAPQYRGAYQRDRDRIVHSTAFRRLEYKTQVFVNHEGDLFRTRLTHSLEVAQIARSIARVLRLNEDLTEAIALAHDLGHTPFGHAGQDALNRCMADFGGFEHNLQSLRVVDKLECRYAEFDGLNLTFETREGILKHCPCPWPGCWATWVGVSSRSDSPRWRRRSRTWPTRSPTTTTMWMTAFAPH